MTKKINKNKTILVIEDEKSLLEAVKTKLEKNDFKVITSRSVVRAFGTPLEENADGSITQSSLLEALKHLESLEEVGAIWLDHNLIGKEDGLDFVTKFKANGSKWSKIPIFVVSNTSDSDLVKTYKKLGVKKYYIKAEHKLEDIIQDINSSLVSSK
jgi:CheY-like chemotaxis protein